MMKMLLPVALLLPLAACVPSVPPAAMQPMPQVYQQIPVNEALQAAVALGDVRVHPGIGKFSLDKSYIVEAKDFREAIQTALTSAKMAAASTGAGKYVLDANLQTIDIPFEWFSKTVQSTVTYQLRRTSDNYILMSETVRLSSKANFAQTLAAGEAVVRIGVANALRENITHMIRLLSSKTEAELLAKGV